MITITFHVTSFIFGLILGFLLTGLGAILSDYLSNYGGTNDPPEHK
jgi:uncharacterized membrane protein